MRCVKGSVQLRWVATEAGGRAFELRNGPDALGRLSLRSRWGTLSEARFAEERWTMRREGYLNPIVAVRVPGAGSDCAIFRPAFDGGGTLEIPGREPVRFQCQDLWGNRWAFVAGDGAPLLQLSCEGSGGFADRFCSDGLAEFPPAFREEPHFGLFLCLGWYLILLLRYETDVTLAATLAALV